jgi:phage protein D
MTGERFAPAFVVEVEGSELAADVSKNITDISVTSEPSTVDHFQLTIVNPFPELPWTHDERASTLFQEGNGIKVQMGYVDALEPLFDGEITKLSPSFPESGSPVLRVEGYSRMHRLRAASHVRTFQDVTDKAVVERIAREAKLGAKADDPGTQHRFVYQRNETDLRFLLRRARRVRYELLVEGKDLVFRKPKESTAKAFTLVWGNPQEGTQGADVFPLRSFNPILDPVAQPTAVVVRGYDTETGDAIEERATAADLDASMGGAENGAGVAETAFGADREVVITDVPVATADEARQLARSELNRRVRRLVTGNGVSIGIPKLRAGAVVDLRGLGRFSGPYYVKSATHAIGASGYQTTFTVERSSLG